MHPPQAAAVWEVRLLACATLLAVLLAMGDNFVLWRWLREVLPLGIMRFPVKVLLLAAFTVPLLAAWGVKWLLQDAGQVKCALRPVGQLLTVIRATFAGYDLEQLLQVSIFGYLFITVGYHLAFFLSTFFTRGGLYAAVTPVLPWLFDLIGLVALVLGVGAFALFLFPQSPTRRRNTEFVVLLAIAGSGAFHQPVFNPTIPAHAFQPGLALAYHADKGALTPAPKLGEYRLMLSPLAERALHTRMVPKFYDDFIGQRLAFWGNLNLLDGLPKVNGASTLVTREWNDVEYFLYGTTNPAPADFMDFLGVTHTTKPGELMQWERRETAMPMVSAGQEQQLGWGEPVLKTILHPDFWNPRQLVVVAGPTNRVELQHARVPATTSVKRFATERLEIEAVSQSKTVVVIAQNFYPSWRATVNGQPAPVLRANHAFQAIPIPAGKSTIRLDYVDWPFRIGAGVSLFTLLGCLVFLRRHTPPA